MIKVCTKCKIEKDIFEFNKDKSRKDGYFIHCKSCKQKYSNDFYNQNKNDERFKKYRHDYYIKNREKFLKIFKKYQINHKDELKKYRNSRKQARQEYQLFKKFGITLNQYNAMLEQQNGVCAICNQKEQIINKNTQKPDMLSVDHNHKTGKIRSLLCHSCNVGLGNFKDNIAFLSNAISYLKRF